MSKKRRVLITGTSGFVGGACATHLRELGHEVVGTVNSRPGHPGDFVVDVRDPRSWAKLPSGTFDVVVHSAALMGPQRFDRPTRDVNIGGTDNAIAFARERGVTHFVQVSTIAAYGLRCVGENRDEASTALSTSRFHPGETEYMRSKAEAERHVEASGLPFTTLRLPVVLGRGSSFAAPAIMGQLSQGRAPYTQSKSHRVSVVCIGNVGPMLESVLEHGPAMRAFNACDHHLRWSDLVAKYGEALGVPVPWQERPLSDFLLKSSDPYVMFWLSNGMIGSHFPSDALEAARPWVNRQTVDEAVRDEVAAYREQPSR